jgi:hypothetical protein
VRFSSWIVIAIGAFLAGCHAGAVQETSVPAAQERVTKLDLTAADIAAVKKGVSERMKDPAAARFGRMAAAIHGEERSRSAGT